MDESGEKTFFVDRKGKITGESLNEARRRKEKEWYVDLLVRTQGMKREDAEIACAADELDQLFELDLETLQKMTEDEPHNGMIVEIIKEKKALAASKWGKKQKTS